MSKNSRDPSRALGAKIKHLREQWQQTVDEVSNTLEIDENTLRAIEAGETMPSENVLEMIISHFLLTDDQANDIRDMADQFKDQASEGLVGGIEDMLMKQIVMTMPDSKILYTDQMQTIVNKNGVVLQFMQSNNSQNPNQQVIVSRVGMSRDHAERMIKVLRATLDQHDSADGVRQLPGQKKDK